MKKSGVILFGIQRSLNISRMLLKFGGQMCVHCFVKMSKSGQIKCNAPGHKECIQYRVWKKRHPLQHRNLVDRAANSPRSAFIPHPVTLKVFERQVRIEGGIMSIVPHCLGVADAHGNHPYTCVNCAK